MKRSRSLSVFKARSFSAVCNNEGSFVARRMCARPIGRWRRLWLELKLAAKRAMAEVHSAVFSYDGT